MSLQLSIYSKHAYREYLLPPLDDSDYAIKLDKEDFALKSDLELSLDVVGSRWNLHSTDAYYIGLEKAAAAAVENGAVIRIVTAKGDEIMVFVLEKREVMAPMKKYSLSQLSLVKIGRDADSDICFDNSQMVSTLHAALRRDGANWSIENKSLNGLYVNEKFVTGKETLQFGDYINVIGLHIVFLGEILAVDDRHYGVSVKLGEAAERAEAEPAPAQANADEEAGKLLFHRAPRNIEKLNECTVEIEEPPAPMFEQRQPLLLTIGPSFTMALPMLLGCLMMVFASKMSGTNTGLFMYSGMLMAISSAGIGVLWALINIRFQRKREAENESRRFDSYSRYLVEKTEEIRRMYRENKEAMGKIHPSAEACSAFGCGTPVLWSRNVTHADFMDYRLGLGDIDFQVKVEIPKEKFSVVEDSLKDKPAYIKENYRTLYQVPVAIDLHEDRMVGLVGGKGKSGAFDIASALCAQIAANNCYTDLKMAFFYNEELHDDRGRLEFARWLPHVWSDDKRMRYIASNKSEAGDVCYELAKVFRKREEESGSGKQGSPHPWYVVFITDLSLAENELLAKYILNPKEEYGLSVVIIAETYEDLPNNCSKVAEKTEAFSGTYDMLQGSTSRRDIKFDDIEPLTLETFARRLSNIEVKEEEAAGEIPSSLTFFEMYGVHDLEDFHVAERWIKNRTYEHIAGMLGERTGGAPCFLDVHEKYHGPHGLVAGTTGSGKSETLQTFLLSLAVNYSPDDVAFFIIDYKGGGMANLFSGLPHLAGRISNLSGSQVNRAMVSIKSENRRRQRVFGANGVNNINSYTKLYKSRTVEEAIPHLFIVIDEFAELKKEEPEFMKELISVAQVGRSLGVHLILATQKPAGTVDDNIWSNSKFRLCLRVQDRQDSMDMLHKGDAAYITQAGRGYLQVGNDEVYELFQSGWSGAPYTKADEGGLSSSAVLLSLTGRERALKRKLKSGAGKIQSGTQTTQLEAVRDYLAEAAEKNHYAGSRMLWLPVLPEKLCLDDIEDYSKRKFGNGGWKEADGEWRIDIVVGKADDPQNQAQFPVTVSYPDCGHMAVVGVSACGKSTLIQTMLYSLVTCYPPDYAHIYVFDFSSKMLSAFSGCAAVGDIMYDGDTDKIRRFFRMLNGIEAERKKLFSGGNFSQYLRNDKKAVPAVVIVIDNYAAFSEKTANEYSDTIIRLSKEGIGLGIFLVISANSFGMNDLPVRISENMGTVLSLQMKDKFAYAEVMRTMRVETLPESGVKGRGLFKAGERILEYQAAVSRDASDDFSRMEAIAAECKKMNESWAGKKARPVPAIPENLEWGTFAEIEEVKAVLCRPRKIPVGFDFDSAGVYSLDLRDFYCYLISGNVRTGRKNFMKALVLSAVSKGINITVVDLKNEGFAAFEEIDGVKVINDTERLYEYCDGELTPTFQERNGLKKDLVRRGYEAGEIYDEMSHMPPIIICIADMQAFLEAINASEKNMDGFFTTLFLKGELHNIYFAGIVNSKSKVNLGMYDAYKAFSGYQTGIHFGGSVGDSPLNFSYIPYRDQVKVFGAGIGMLPEVNGRHEIEKIAVPLVRIRRGREKDADGGEAGRDK